MSARNTFRSVALRRFQRRFCLNQDGFVLIYVTFMLPVLFGLTVLAIDVGRLFALDSTLQQAADALALAGAKELDRQPDAFTRGCLAIQNTVRNTTLFAKSGQMPVAGTCDLVSGSAGAASPVSWVWLSSISPDVVALRPEDAQFVQVTTKSGSTSFAPLFPVPALGFAELSTLTRSAVAGTQLASCRRTPIWICNPWEAEGVTTRTALNSQKVGSLIEGGAWDQSPSSSPGPGNFDLVDLTQSGTTCTGGSGGNVSALKSALAGADAPSCQFISGVCPQTGYIASLQSAINTRFDIYEGAYKSFSVADATSLAPAARTIWRSNQKLQQQTQSASLACQSRFWIESSTSSVQIWYPRASNWDRQLYFTANGYNTSSSLSIPGYDQSVPLGSLTRHQTYLWETTQSMTASWPYATPSSQTCFANRYSGGSAAGAALLDTMGLDARRTKRDLYAAMLNCNAIGTAISQGASYSFTGGSSKTPLPILGIAALFITEPVNKVLKSTSETSILSNAPSSQCNPGGGSGSTIRFTVPSSLAPDQPLAFMISSAEASRIDFTVADNNGDGKIDASEVQSALQAAGDAYYAANSGAKAFDLLCADTATTFFIRGNYSNPYPLVYTGLVDGYKKMNVEFVGIYDQEPYSGSVISRRLVRLYR